MKKVYYSFCALLVFILGACSADMKVPEIASDMCACYKPLQDSLSEEAKSLIISSAGSTDISKAMQDGIGKLDTLKQLTVSLELMKLDQAADNNSSIGRCLKDLEKKYDKDYTLNENTFLDKVIKELDSKKECGLTAALMKIGMTEMRKEGSIK